MHIARKHQRTFCFLQGCTACPPGMTEMGWENKLLWILVVMCCAFAAGAAVLLLLFKSKILDDIVNFFYRVRANPIMAITQASTYTHQHISAHSSVCNWYQPSRRSGPKVTCAPCRNARQALLHTQTYPRRPARPWRGPRPWRSLGAACARRGRRDGAPSAPSTPVAPFIGSK